MPGPARVPTESIARLLERRLIEPPGGTEPPGGAVAEPLEALEPLEVLGALGEEVLGVLRGAGYDTPGRVAAATDKELEALPKIGRATVAKIRAALEG